MFILSLFLLNCTKESIKPGMPAEDVFNVSKRAYEKKDYNRAIEGFKKLVFEHPGSELIARAQFYLAESYVNTRDYEDAIIEYRFLIDNFPESPLLDDASFKLGLAYYKSSPSYYLEQKRTEEALRTIERFISFFPESEWVGEAKKVERECLNKLSKKELENGKLYYKLGNFESAEIYLKDLLEVYPTSSNIQEARFTLALCYKKLDRGEEAKDILEELVSEEGVFSEKARKELELLVKDK